ncbi:MAG: polysaccharide biosynthesis C-terminal domain-containing protein [Planctomycetes bacterium]|nr:polysaccharide biosynthesis C-terminal domain-containing protein [Planctomycetota bacterium]
MNFRRWVVFTFLVHALVVAVDKGGGLILYLLTANQPQEHGRSGVAASLPFILGAVANLGLATSLVYFVRRGKVAAQVAFETSLTVALVWGGAVAGAALLFCLYVMPWLDPEWRLDWFGVLPICLVVPLLLVASYANSTQLATERIKDYGVVHVATSIGFLPAFFAIFYLLGGSVTKGDVPLAVAWGRLVSTFGIALLSLWMVRKVVTVRARVDRGYLGEALRYGWRANLTSTLTYLNHRLDLVVLGFIYATSRFVDGMDDEAVLAVKNVAMTQVAYYSMAVTWAELVWHFPEAMRDLFFSKVAGSSHEQARQLTPVLSRLGLLISLLGAVAIVLLVDPIMGTITWLAGKDPSTWYDGWSAPVSECLWVLVPGTVGFTVSKVLQADLAARDRLQTCVNAQVLVLVVMLGLDLWLVPGEGAKGAAIASTVAYLIGTLWTLVAYSASTGTSAWRCLFVHVEDFRYIREIAAAVLGKLRRQKP